MKLLLINQNPVVSRMMHMSVPKAGFELEECESVYDLPKGRYEVVILDDEMYDKNFLHDIKQNIQYDQLGIITSSKGRDFADFDFILIKPFLPTDLIEMLRKIKSTLTTTKEQTPIQKNEKKKVESVESSQELSDETRLQEESSIQSLEVPEPIVEVEEDYQESPFVDEPLEKAGILKENEINEVTALLEESDVSNHEESLEEQQSTMEEDEELQEEGQTEIVLPQEKEEKFEESQKSGEPQEDKEDEQKQESEALLTPEAMLTATQESPQEASLNDLKRELQKLDVKGLREILDGMQLEITIKISYPDRTDV